MIEVENITKHYGKHLALDNISFKLNEGDILGFLGSNGAGKSTTMNIITGYISSDSGTVKINGHDILEEPLEAKKNIGYLPEVPPLYNDMTVEKYLEFMYKLKKVRLSMKEHIKEICEMVQIDDVGDRIIKNLSKGYKQRVGIAQALLGYPPVLILDEPTSGLDPAQIIEIRKLVRDLGKKHTVILSSHVLSEVQAVCDKILVINNGKIVADGETDSLTQLGSETRKIKIVAEGREQNLYSVLKSVDRVTEVKKMGESEKGCYEFIVESTADVRRAVSKAIARADGIILLMQPEGRSLEETFLNIISGNEEV